MKEKIILVGGGGHCRSVIDVIESEGKFEIAGIIDNSKSGEEILGYKIVGSDADLPALVKQFKNVVITVGQIKSPATRISLYQMLKKLGAHFPIIVSGRAYVSKHASLGEGTVVMHDALVNAGAKIGNNCILNTKSLCEHDSIVKDHCHISTGAVLNGGTILEAGSFVGSNSVLRDNKAYPENSVIPYGEKR